MSEFRLASLDAEGRLELTARRHEVAWLPRDKAGAYPCVVELPEPNRLFITTSKIWAEVRRVSEQTAESDIAGLPEVLRPREIPQVLLADAIRKGQGHTRGPSVYRITLPDIAVWWLLPPLDAAFLSTRGGSIQILVRSTDKGLHAWGAPVPGLVSSGALTLTEYL